MTRRHRGTERKKYNTNSIIFSVIFPSNNRDGSFSILIWVTLFGTLKNPPFPPFQGGIDKFPPSKRGIKGDLKTSIIEFVTLVVNHAK
jgi:hypothetical protein